MHIPSKNQWCVYILECGDGSLYTGVTNNLTARIAVHQAGKGAKYTRSHLPVRLVYCESSEGRSQASQREAEIKKMTTNKKRVLISQSLS